MRRLLIADAAGEFGETLQKQLQDLFLIEICHTGEAALELFSDFDPDILLLDLQMPGVDGLSLLHSLRTSGRTAKIVVVSNHFGDPALAALERYGVSQAFRKPCALSGVVACIRELGFQSENADSPCLEMEVDRLLLSFGLRMGPDRYRTTFEALCLKYENCDASVTKEIYPFLAKKYGSNDKQVEKAIRDAIKAAWERGNRSVWKLYFPPGRDGALHCPGNDEFLTRLAKALRYRSVYKLPYKPVIEKAQ